MKISKLLKSVYDIAIANNLSVPYIVGGIPRDLIMGNENSIEDIDVTTGDSGSLNLAHLCHKQWPETFFKEFDDGHASINFKNIKLDFSSNFIAPDIEKKMAEIGISSPTDLQKEIYSRDFTINTLLKPMDDLNKDIIDITGKGIDDCKNKILRGPISGEFSFINHSNRIVRAIRLSVKMDLKFSKELGESIRRLKNLLIDVSDGYINREINRALREDTTKTVAILVNYKLLPIMPLSKMLTMELAKQRMVQHILD